MTEPRVSVVIPVRNAVDKIGTCLEAVLSQSLKPIEVIVIDGRSTDGTVEKVRQFPVKLFLDCIPSRDWLQNLVANFEEGIVGVGGGIENVGEGLWLRSINTAQNTFLGGGISIQTRLFREKRFVKSISASNSMYRRGDLAEVGGFNIHLSGADEAELGRRLVKRKAGKLLYVPSALVVHNHGRNLKEFARNMYNYGGWRRECGVWDLPASPPLLAPLVLVSLIFTRWIFLSLFGLYLIAIMAAGLKLAVQQRDLRFLLTTPVVYVVEHTCYVLGFWKQTVFPRKMPGREKL